MQWNTEWSLFLATYIASALAALSPLLLSQKALTFRLLLGTALFYGGLGSSFAMVVGWEWLGWKNSPVKVLALSILVGLGAIKKSDVTVILRRMFGINDERLTRNSSVDNDKPNKT